MSKILTILPKDDILKIKLVRWGFVKKPFYVLSVMKRRQGCQSGNKYEDLGWWDPSAREDGNTHFGIKLERLKYWMAQGAEPTDKVYGLLGQAGILPRRPLPPKLKESKGDEDIKWRPELQKN
uniref:Mitochondrial ribosomal protein S16 n=1 Tax=Polytomella parva TaxID=51329 RepID=A0A7S0UIM7_9CHLO|mmetsp:Transcript_10485/g.19245  ORF Transcript_10485/g.19245 Transcript_10485/m.19245 type:complete len:123 (+) Transcript_10485:59-427(+)